MEPLVSVVIPCHRPDNFLPIAIRSALDSDYSNLEVILCLDQITSQDLEHLDLPQDPRFTIVSSQGVGIEDALNYGISVSKGNLICRLDSDDFMASNRISVQTRKLIRSNSVLIGSSIYLVCAHGRRQGIVTYPLAIRNNAIFKPIGSQVAHPAVLFRKDIFESAGHYRQGYPAAEDFDLWNRMLRFGKFRNILRPLTNYRQHEAQISIVKRSQQLNSTRAIAIQDLTDSISLQNSNWKFVQTFVFSFRRFLIFNFLEAQALLSDTTTEAELDSRSAKNLLLNRYKKIVSLVVSHPTIAPSIIRALILNLFSKLFIKQYCEKCHEA